MVYQPDPLPESAGEPRPPRSRAGYSSPTQALRVPSHTLDAQCPQCAHRWTVAHLPMRLDKVAALCQRAACAKCGNTSPVLASNGGGE
jgi:hypothetical protein